MELEVTSTINPQQGGIPAGCERPEQKNDPTEAGHSRTADALDQDFNALTENRPGRG